MKKFIVGFLKALMGMVAVGLASGLSIGALIVMVKYGSALTSYAFFIFLYFCLMGYFYMKGKI